MDYTAALATYERNDVVPTVTNAIKLSEYFKVPMEYLVYGKKVIKDDFFTLGV